MVVTGAAVEYSSRVVAKGGIQAADATNVVHLKNSDGQDHTTGPNVIVRGVATPRATQGDALVNVAYVHAQAGSLGITSDQVGYMEALRGYDGTTESRTDDTVRYDQRSVAADGTVEYVAGTDSFDDSQQSLSDAMVDRSILANRLAIERLVGTGADFDPSGGTGGNGRVSGTAPDTFTRLPGTRAGSDVTPFDVTSAGAYAAYAEAARTGAEAAQDAASDSADAASASSGNAYLALQGTATGPYTPYTGDLTDARSGADGATDMYKLTNLAEALHANVEATFDKLKTQQAGITLTRTVGHGYASLNIPAYGGGASGASATYIPLINSVARKTSSETGFEGNTTPHLVFKGVDQSNGGSAVTLAQYTGLRQDIETVLDHLTVQNFTPEEGTGEATNPSTFRDALAVMSTKFQDLGHVVKEGGSLDLMVDYMTNLRDTGSQDFKNLAAAMMSQSTGSIARMERAVSLILRMYQIKVDLDDPTNTAIRDLLHIPDGASGDYLVSDISQIAHTDPTGAGEVETLVDVGAVEIHPGDVNDGSWTPEQLLAARSIVIPGPVATKLGDTYSWNIVFVNGNNSTIYSWDDDGTGSKKLSTNGDVDTTQHGQRIRIDAADSDDIAHWSVFITVRAITPDLEVKHTNQFDAYKARRLERASRYNAVAASHQARVDAAADAAGVGVDPDKKQAFDDAKAELEALTATTATLEAQVTQYGAWDADRKDAILWSALESGIEAHFGRMLTALNAMNTAFAAFMAAPSSTA